MPSSGDEVAVPSATSCGTSLLSPTASSGISEGRILTLDRPLPPDADLVITSGDIPPFLSPPLMHSDSTEDENGGGDSGNTNEEEVPVHAIAYAVVDPEEPELFIAEHVPSELLSTFPEKSIGV